MVHYTTLVFAAVAVLALSPDGAHEQLVGVAAPCMRAGVP